jgi:predicted CXXCH cytochrome family protein
MTRRQIAALAVSAALLAAAGVVVAQGWETTLGVGTDLAGDLACLSCHVAVKGAWEHESTHALIHDCRVCHAVSAPSGKGHAAKRACADCHSEKAHPSGAAACASCHRVHGTANRFLIPDTFNGRPMLLATPEGRSATGLAHGDGTGICETCHAATAHYTRAGGGGAHEAGWCVKCHSHQNGFAPGPVE